jgi:hypothetical protein
MSAAAKLLARLARVSQHGRDRWRAVCPAHESRNASQSLAVRELDDGTVLIRCHAGCGAADIVKAVGLELKDLFPANHRAPKEPRQAQRPNHYHAARAALRTISREAVIVLLVASDVAAGRTPTHADLDRCALAAGRIRHALEGVE